MLPRLNNHLKAHFVSQVPMKRSLMGLSYQIMEMPLTLTMMYSWVRTGDIAKITKTGEVHVVDRLKVDKALSKFSIFTHHQRITEGDNEGSPTRSRVTCIL